jgi:hypothetical protein
MKLLNQLALANRVLRELKTNKYVVPDKPMVTAFSNGREQGYTLWFHEYNDGKLSTRAVSFAEHRSSDDVVVYIHNNYNLYNDTTASIDWNTAQHFASTETGIQGACEYITAVLNGTNTK